jgi:hypothetical protein
MGWIQTLRRIGPEIRFCGKSHWIGIAEGVAGCYEVLSVSIFGQLPLHHRLEFGTVPRRVECVHFEVAIS